VNSRPMEFMIVKVNMRFIVSCIFAVPKYFKDVSFIKLNFTSIYITVDCCFSHAFP
jgi:hypothetical protein